MSFSLPSLPFNIDSTTYILLIAVLPLFILRALSMKITMLRMRGLETLQSFLGISHGMRPEGFGTILRMVPTRVEGDSKVVSDYDVPKHLCTKATKNDTAKLPLSVLMSVFDDVSTWPIVVKDKQHRPGVSVHLSAELLDPSRPISPSTPLRIESTVDKSGRMLAFCSIHAYNRDSGELVATGKHTKFLPMGFVFEFMFQRFMPLLHLYASNFGPYRNSNDMLMKNGTSKNILDIIGPLEMTTSGTTTETNFRVGPLHKNPMGGMHGGCQSVVSQLVAEAGVSDLTASSGAKKKKPVLRSMSMTYMSTGRKQCDVESHVVGNPTKDHQLTANVAIKREGSNNLISTGSFKFDLVNK